MKISVIGAGQMGNGIAHVFAQGGHDVVLIDIAQASLDNALTTIDKNMGRQVEKGKLTGLTSRPHWHAFQRTPILRRA